MVKIQSKCLKWLKYTWKLQNDQNKPKTSKNDWIYSKPLKWPKYLKKKTTFNKYPKTSKITKRLPNL